VPSYGENTVAEYAFALILALSRKIYDSYDRIRETGSFNLDGLRGFDLKGKTLGVVGTGRIGKNVIRIAKGFEMEVIAYDPYPDDKTAQAMGFRYVSLEELLTQSKVVSLHVPLLPETTHLINDKTLELMAPDSFLINTARGGVVDTQALVRAIKAGQLAGAALDVLEEEGVVKDELSFLTSSAPAKSPDLKTVLANHILIDLPNVIVTPHNAFNTKEALERIMDTTVDNIRNYIIGQPTSVVSQHE
jgi:D-lactate dehydrogenase